MMRKLAALIVSSAVLLGSMTAASSAQSPSAQPGTAVPPTGTVLADRNPTPLAPAGAAGIRQAQGISETAWHVIGLGFFGGVVLAMILIDGGDDDVATTTTTN